MENINASTFKDKSDKYNEERRTRISHIVNMIDQATISGDYRLKVAMLYERQIDALKGLGFEVTHDKSDEWIISWENPTK